MNTGKLYLTNILALLHDEAFFVEVSIVAQKKVGQVMKSTNRGNPTYKRQNDSETCMTIRRGCENETLETTFSCNNSQPLRSHSGRSHVILPDGEMA